MIAVKMQALMFIQLINIKSIPVDRLLIDPPAYGNA
jgi:hypothetical protein